MLHRTCTAEFVFLKNSYLLFSFTPQGFISLRVSPETFPNELNCCTKDNCAAWPPLHSVYLIYLNSDSNVWCQIITVVTVKSLKLVLNKCFCSNNSKDCSSESFKSYFLSFQHHRFLPSTLLWSGQHFRSRLIFLLKLSFLQQYIRGFHQAFMLAAKYTPCIWCILTVVTLRKWRQSVTNNGMKLTRQSPTTMATVQAPFISPLLKILCKCKFCPSWILTLCFQATLKM